MHSLVSIITAIILTVNLYADTSWPTYRHDNARSGMSPTDLTLPLKPIWDTQSAPPQQAWTGPAKWDAFAKIDGLQSMRNFDPCYFTTGQSNFIYYSSSSDNAVHCLDATSGKEIWHYFTEAAVRFPPTLYKNLALFGSDDGFAYAVDAKTGKLVWKFKETPNSDPSSNRRIPSNGKFISLWPIRTSILIHNDLAYFGASLVPWRKSYLFAIDPITGKKSDLGFVTEMENVTLQGALLASQDRIYAPQGRTVPLVFSAAKGNKLGQVPQAGGVFAILDADGHFFAGPQNQRTRTEEVRAINTKNNTRIATFGSANRLVVANHIAYLHTDKKLKAFDLKKKALITEKIGTLQPQVNQLNKELKQKPAKEKIAELTKKRNTLNQQINQLKKSIATCWLWEKESPLPFDLIATPTQIIAGFDGQVSIISRETGETTWTTPVQGKAHGLSLINNQLYISTDQGAIHTFATNPTNTPKIP